MKDVKISIHILSEGCRIGHLVKEISIFSSNLCITLSMYTLSMHTFTMCTLSMNTLYMYTLSMYTLSMYSLTFVYYIYVYFINVYTIYVYQVWVYYKILVSFVWTTCTENLRGIKPFGETRGSVNFNFI